MTAVPLTPLEDAIVARIAQAASRQPAAAAVWVFGSRARGASTEYSDLDIAVEFSTSETSALRAWLEQVRIDAEAPITAQWPGFVNLVGLFASDHDSRLAQRIHAEGTVRWQRSLPGVADTPPATAIGDLTAAR
jgi:predicted nucleotidyltransferase